MFVSRKRHMREIAAWRSRASEYLAGADEARAALQKDASLLDAGETPSVTVRRIDVLLDRLGIFRPLNDAAQRWTLRDLWDADRRLALPALARLAGTFHVPHPLNGVLYADGMLPCTHAKAHAPGAHSVAVGYLEGEI